MVLNHTALLDGDATHPYYPLGVAIPEYAANTLSTPVILVYFATTCGSILLASHLLIRAIRPTLSTSDMITALWFVLSSAIHLCIEGYFAWNAQHMPGQMDPMGQAWKVYSLSDSRYLTGDAFVVCMETITAVFWGPLSMLCAYCIATDHPLRHALQTIISLGQLYGDVLYYATCTFEDFVRGVVYSRPEPEYFWGLYIFLNSFWIVIPSILLFQSAVATTRAFAKVQALEAKPKKA